MRTSTLRAVNTSEVQKDNPASVYLATLAPTGRRSMYSQLKLALKVLGIRSTVERYHWATLGYAQIVTVRAKLLEQGRSPHSVNLALAALRGTMQCAFHLGLVDADCVLRVKAVRRVAVASGPRGRSLTPVEVRKLLSCGKNDRTPIGIRDTALLAVLVCTGMRRAELCALYIDDYDIARGELVIHRAKGNRERICPLSKGARQLLAPWLSLRGKGTGPMFCRIRKAGTVILQSLSTQSIYDIVQHRAESAGIGTITPHDLRRTFVTTLLSSTGDINLVRGLVGHSDVKTTARYDLRIHDAQKQIEQLVQF